jgi:hypothetical protein
LLGVTTATLRNWQRAGCPVAEAGGKGRATRYNSAAVFDWRLRLSLAETDLPLDEARRRKLAAEAKLAEMALDVKRGELTPTQPLILYIEQTFGNYKKSLQALPARYGAQIAAEVGCDVAKLDRALSTNDPRPSHRTFSPGGSQHRLDKPRRPAVMARQAH